MRNLVEENGTICLECESIEKVQEYRQKQNREALEAFLAQATVTFHEKEYGVTETDQNEMQAILLQHNLLTTSKEETMPEWHAKHEKNEPFTISEMLELLGLIREFVKPHVEKMQAIKVRIYDAKTVQEVLKIGIFSQKEDGQEEKESEIAK
ncbi:MAG: hypothetical protein ACLU5E_01475 [Anaerovoracaceae bacterium]